MRIVRSIQVNPESVDLAYMDDTDVRCKGFVAQTHHLSVSRGGSYDDEIDTLEAAADALVTDVLVDFDISPPVDFTVDEDDDDDEEYEQ